MAKFVDCNQSQLYLLPVDMREWLPEDDLAHFVVEAVERVPLGSFRVNERGTGSALFTEGLLGRKFSLNFKER